MNNSLTPKTVKSSQVIMTEMVLPSHINALGSIFGGVIMSWIDIAAAICAQRHSNNTVVTASIDALNFVAPVYKGWIVNLKASINYASTTSMEIGVRIDAENPITGKTFHTATAYLTFVAIDANLKPVPVPSYCRNLPMRNVDMKPQKLEDNIDLKEKKPLNLKNNKGFSLIELMTTTAIGLIVSMGIASVFSFAMEQFTILVEKNEAETSVLNTAYYLRSYLSQGIDVYAVNNVAAVGFLPPACALPACNTAGAGQLDVNFEMLDPASWGGAGDVGAFSIFAAFNREAGTYNGSTNTMPNAGSVMRTTGIFVRDTDANGINPDEQSGAVAFDFNSNGGPMFPDSSDLVFARLHNFRIQRIPAGAANCPGGYAVEVVIQSNGANNGQILPCLPAGGWPVANTSYKVKTASIEILTRYFKNLPKGDWNYRAPIGGGFSAPYMDIANTVKINFKDNVLTRSSLTGGSAEQRVFGSLYFFDYVVPNR